MLAYCVLLLGILVLSESQLTWNFESDPTSIFHGYIIEKSQEIFVHPPLHVKLEPGSKLCHLHLLPTATHSVPNFISTQILDPERGNAKLVLNESALYAARLRGDPALDAGVFHLKVAGEDCSHPHHTTRPWSINLLLVPTDRPVWAEREYTFQVDSTLPAGSIVGKVTAYAALDMERGRDNQMGDDTGMCNYAIDHPEKNYFDINGHGVIRSRVALEHYASRRFLINVTGFDCYSPVPRRSTVRVTVIVRPNCTIEWQAIEPELIYTALPRAHWVSPNATLKTCDNAEDIRSVCHPTEATLRVKLLWSREEDGEDDDDVDENADDKEDRNDSVDLVSTNGKQSESASAFVCDFDRLSVRAHSQSCGVLPDTVVELLPTDQETPILFNGSSQTDVTSDRLPIKQHRLDNVPFTLTFWMRHGPHSAPEHPTNPDEANGREHIVCNADEEEKNRHHFAVYVHNCKLTMLLRREPVNQRIHEQARLYPSQWRFSVEDVCDNQWHHYALSFRPPPVEVVQGSAEETDDWTVETQVKLLIDGDPVPIDADLVQITEDVPMHELRHHSTKTRMSVGACWHSRIARHVQHFKGELAAMMLSVGATMPQEQIQCLANCYPRLHVTGPLKSAQLPDLPPLHQSRLDNLIIQANHLTDLTDLMQHVIFFNPRVKLLPMRRPEPMAIRLSTTVNYPSQCQTSNVQDVTIRLVRLPLTTTVQNSVWSGPRFNPPAQSSQNYDPTEHLVSSTGRVVPMYSLVLQSSPALTDPITISSTALVQGVWLFPSVELSWIPLTKPSGAEATGLNDAVSHCDVDLCPAEPIDREPLEFARQETITVGTEFLPTALHVEQSSNGMRFRGPVGVKEYTQTLQHLKWFNLEHLPPRKRCFRLICVAQADTHGGPRLMVQSNVVQAKFDIEPIRERVRPRVAKAVDRFHRVPVPVPRADHPSPSKMKQQSPVVPEQDPRMMPVNRAKDDADIRPSEPNMNDPSWNRSLHVTYTLIGCAIAIVLAAIALGLTHFFRNRRQPTATVPAAKKNGWAPVPSISTDPSNGPVAPGIQKHPQAIVKRPSEQKHATLEVIINPTTHQKEFEEMENKFCFYDRKMYDEEGEDILDPDNPAFQDTIYDSEQDRVYRSYLAEDDPHEDVSDFDVPSDRETPCEAVTGGTNCEPTANKPTV